MDDRWTVSCCTSCTVGNARSQAIMKSSSIARSQSSPGLASAVGQVVRLIGQFVNQDLSSFYFEIAKDRLYADGAGSHSRRAAQTVLCAVLQTVTNAVSPVLCHFAQV